jgi:hypothetical protein
MIIERYIGWDDKMIIECEAVDLMRIGRGIQNTRRKPVPVPICPQEISRDKTWDTSGY